MSEFLAQYSALAADFGSRVHGATDWSATAPCEGWTARDVVAHVVGGHRGLIAATGGAPVAELTADEDIVGAWDAATEGIKAVLSDPSKVAMAVPGPMGEMPAGQMIARFMCTDVLVHTWDLARATGQDESLQADAVRMAYSGLKPMDAMLRRPGVFGPKVAAPAGADEQTEFLCFLGRTV